MTRVGIVGRGWGERSQAPNFRDAGLDVVAVVGHDDWRRAIDAADLVTIVTPPSTHLEIATAALNAGKHVICEKPTALNAADAQKLLDASRAHPRQIAIIDHELRFLPSFRAARERIGDLGAIRYAEVRYASPSRGDRSRAWNWWSDASQGGGVWGAVGSHFIDALRYLGLEIEQVQASLATIIGERSGKKVTSDDFAAVHLRLRGGALAAMTFSAVASGPDEATALTIHGEDGAFRLTGEELLFAKPRSGFERIAGGDLSKRPGNSPGGAFGTGTYHLGLALKRALDDGDRDALSPAATFSDGLAQQRVLDAARRSNSEAGTWIRV
ncbi:MAG TPA: Gfo/Idh/MocA family oxidoreductase [Thermoanaerobaculia bacterium]|nr:Gfo/Idh/MocA family oxidoreductase [Thermoanaerobaculia bacterium]